MIVNEIKASLISHVDERKVKYILIVTFINAAIVNGKKAEDALGRHGTIK